MFLLLERSIIHRCKEDRNAAVQRIDAITPTLMKFVVGIVWTFWAKDRRSHRIPGVESLSHAMTLRTTNSAGVIGTRLCACSMVTKQTCRSNFYLITERRTILTMIAGGNSWSWLPSDRIIYRITGSLIIGGLSGKFRTKTFRKAAADAMPIITFFMMIPIGAGMSLKSIALGGVGGVVRQSSQHCQHFYSTSCSSY